jgi:hypothetical protein
LQIEEARRADHYPVFKTHGGKRKRRFPASSAVRAVPIYSSASDLVRGTVVPAIKSRIGTGGSRRKTFRMAHLERFEAHMLSTQYSIPGKQAFHDESTPDTAIRFQFSWIRFERCNGLGKAQETADNWLI